MKRHAKYNLATGEILAVLRCSDEIAALQVREGVAVLPLPDDFTGDDTTHRIVDGEAVPI